MMFFRFTTAMAFMVLAVCLSGQETGFSQTFWWPDAAVGLSREPVKSLVMSPFGEVYLGTTRGLMRWNGHRGEVLSGRDGVPAGYFHHLSFGVDSVLTGWVDTLPFLYDGGRFLAPAPGVDPVKDWPGLPSGDARPTFQDSLGRIYYGTADGFLIEYQTGWEHLETPGCDMPWSVINEKGKGSFILPCHKTGFQRYSKTGEFLQKLIPDPSGLPEGMIQLFPGYIPLSDAEVLVGGFWGVFRFQGDNATLPYILEHTVEAFSRDPLDGSICFAGPVISRVMPDGSLERNWLPIPKTIVSHHSATDMRVEAEEIWVTGKLGVGRYDRVTGDWETFTMEQGNLPSYSPYHVFRSPDGRLLFGLRDGLAILDEDNRRIVRLYPELIGEQVGDILQYAGDILIIMSARRCYFFQEKDSGLHLLRVFDEADGLRILEYNENGAMIDEGNSLYITDFTGVYRYDLNRLSGQLHCRTHLIPEKIGDHLISYRKTPTAQLVHFGRSLPVRFRITGAFAAMAIPEYRINGGDWLPFGNGDNTIIEDAPYGAGLLELRARIPARPASDWPVHRIPVFVKWPLLDYPFVQLTLVLTILILFIFTIRYLVQTIRERREIRKIRRQLADYRNKAIEARLDPGFLMKVIRSILVDIQLNDRQKASRQLVQLARTMRRILDISFGNGNDSEDMNGLIPLDQELDFIHDLIDLEANRRPSEFTFHCDVDPVISEENPLIPALILSPVVIWLLHPELETNVNARSISLSIGGTIDHLVFAWKVIPVSGESYDHLSMTFGDTQSGRDLLERIQLYRQLDTVIELETFVVENCLQITIHCTRNIPVTGKELL